jgi:branched-chain amino acid transport system ATP-binding protein
LESDRLLTIDGLITYYGRVPALRGVTLDIAPGEIVAVIGPNGAGKTTLVKTIIGALKPRAGVITFQGEEIHGRPSDKIVAKGIAIVPEGRRVFASLTVAENMLLGGYLVGDKTAHKNDLDTMFALFPILARRQKQLAGSLSGGEQQMLAVARALLSRPKLVMMDEPTLGLAPKLVQQMGQHIAGIPEQFGTAVLLVEQNAMLATGISHRVYVMERGMCVASGSAEEFHDEDRLAAAYWGEDPQPQPAETTGPFDAGART